MIHLITLSAGNMDEHRGKNCELIFNRQSAVPRSSSSSVPSHCDTELSRGNIEKLHVDPHSHRVVLIFPTPGIWTFDMVQLECLFEKE